MGDLDWQWNVNPWAKQDSPAAAVRYFLLATDGADHSIERLAFRWLLYGQRSNRVAQRRYDQCYARGSRHLFHTVVTSAPTRAPDLDEAATHLEWQVHNDILSLRSASHAWNALPSSDVNVGAMYSALCGQQHNANTCQLYRSCFAHFPAAFFALIDRLLDQVRSGELLHPYLQGGVPRATDIRDEVPYPLPSTET